MQHRHINSFASVPQNGMKIAVMKVSHRGGEGGNDGAGIIIFDL